jgi:hypothetical protein
MVKKIGLVLLALILFAAPVAGRWLSLYEGTWKAAEVPRPDLMDIRAPAPQAEPFDDRPADAVPGIILVDLAHDNRFEVAELNVLRARLAARGQRLELLLSDEGAPSLAGRLRYAKALVVISPGKPWQAGEIQQVHEFVAKGGHLLLVTDPTRYGFIYDESGYAIALDSDAQHMNDLAAWFGLLFQDDYLYNTTENEGNFRNIRLTDLAAEPLTAGLTQVVFYATHSIVSDQPALIRGSGDTRSSRGEGASDLVVATLAADGRVLALGDLTFMTEPYSDTHDNHRLISNVADFLASAQRRYVLGDFPFFFDYQVDLVYAGEPLLDSDLLRTGAALQAKFEAWSRELILRESESPGRDTLILGLYQEAEELDRYLAAAQIRRLLLPTTPAADEDGPSSPAPARQTGVVPVAPTPGLNVTPPALAGAGVGITVTAEVSPSTQSRIAIGSLGEVVITGTALLLLQDEGNRKVMLLLADTEAGLERTLERLSEGNLEGCVSGSPELPESMTWALCPTGEVEAGKGEGGWKGPPEAPAEEPAAPSITDTEPVTDTVTPEPPPGAGGRVLVIALDDGEGVYDSRTSAAEYEAILRQDYDVTVWSQAELGSPDPSELGQYGLVIWTAGDFRDAFGEQDREMLFMQMLDGIPAILSGAYIGDTDTRSIQRDIRLVNADHPLARGFRAGQVVTFLPGPSGSDYAMDLLEEMGDEDEEVVFVRGPESDNAGSPSVFVVEDVATGMRVAFLGFPLYLLREDAARLIVLNAVSWMMGP